jgi:hypothetical protein
LLRNFDPNYKGFQKSKRFLCSSILTLVVKSECTTDRWSMHARTRKQETHDPWYLQRGTMNCRDDCLAGSAYDIDLVGLPFSQWTF